MLTGGYIKLFRSLVNWEWYDDVNVKILFIHLLLTVNYEPKQWQGIMINAGQRVTSIEKLSSEVKLTIQQTRTALNKLKLTGEITIKSTNKYTLITVENYTKYQEEECKNNKQITNEQQTDNKRITTMEESNKNINNNIISIYDIFDSYSDNPELRQALRDYSVMRNKIKAPLTDRAARMLLNKLDTLAATDDLKIKIIEQAILGNWKSVFPLKQEDKKQQAPKVTPVKTNKFHNFVQRDDDTDLEALARKKMEAKIRELSSKKEVENV